MAVEGQGRIVLDDLARIANRLTQDESFYGHFLAGLEKELSERTATMGVTVKDNRIRLIVNPDFWMNEIKEDIHKQGLLKHELLHIVFGHVYYVKKYAQRRIYNMACDLVVNQYISRDQLPGDHLRLEDYPDADLTAGETADHYYHQLLALFDKQQEEGEDINEIFDFFDEECNPQKAHGGWTRISDLSNQEIDAVREHVNGLIESAVQAGRRSDQWGRLSGDIVKELENISLKYHPALNWRRMIRIFTEQSGATKIKNTIRRPSKRYGTSPGIKVTRRKKLLVGLDTSGSVSRSETATFWKEIFHLWKQGIDVEVAEFDTEIRKKYAYSGGEVPPPEGGGGTDFNCILTLSNQRPFPDGLIIFTDGKADKPGVHPRHPVLWVLTQNGRKTEEITDFPGKKIRIKTTDY